MQLVVLCGGLGTRLGEITLRTPKIMVPVLGEPFIEHFLRQHKKNGFDRFLFIGGYLVSKIAKHLNENSTLHSNCEIKLHNEGPVRLGTGGAIKSALHLLDENFAVTYGDSFLTLTADEMTQFTSKRPEITSSILIYKNNDRFDTSNISIDANGLVVEYRKGILGKYRYIDAGLIAFFDGRHYFYDHKQNVFDLSEIILDLVSKNSVSSVQCSERFYEIGSKSGINDFEQHIAKERIK